GIAAMGQTVSQPTQAGPVRFTIEKLDDAPSKAGSPMSTIYCRLGESGLEDPGDYVPGYECRDFILDPLDPESYEARETELLEVLEAADDGSKKVAQKTLDDFRSRQRMSIGKIRAYAEAIGSDTTAWDEKDENGEPVQVQIDIEQLVGQEGGGWFEPAPELTDDERAAGKRRGFGNFQPLTPNRYDAACAGKFKPNVRQARGPAVEAEEEAPAPRRAANPPPKAAPPEPAPAKAAPVPVPPKAAPKRAPAAAPVEPEAAEQEAEPEVAAVPAAKAAPKAPPKALPRSPALSALGAKR
ncbi:MAG: hypothetical protein WC869_08065, partial [Phycisphaerae bacterium]